MLKLIFLDQLIQKN